MKRLLFPLFVLCSATSFAAPVSVRVVDDKGAPVAGAKVWFQASQDEDATLTTTDEKGEARGETSASEDATYRGHVTVLAPGKAVGGSNLTKETAEIKLVSPVSLSGVVQDKDGKPVANAPVRLIYLVQSGGGFRITTMPGQGAMWDVFRTTSDATGRWAFDFLAPGHNAIIELVDARFVRLQSQIVLPATGSILARPFIARAGAQLEGRIVDENGKPLSGVRVYANSDGDSRDDAVTGADGTYRMTRLATGVFKVRVLSKRDAERVAAPRLGVRAEEGKTNPVADLVMTPGALIEGKATDSKTGAPVALVSLASDGKTARTLDDGTYRLRVVPGEVRLYVAGKPENYALPKFASLSGQFNPNTGLILGQMNLTLAEGETKRFDFTLEPLQSLAGRVVDEQGQPATGAKILARQKWNQLPGVMGKDGTFSVAGLEPGEVTFAALGEWTVVKPEKVTVPAKEPLVVTLRRSPIVPVVGRVVDEEGAPVAGVEVAVQEMVPTGNGGGSSGGATNILTDAQGEWKWTPSRVDAELSVKAKKEGYRFVSGGTLTKRKEVMGVNGALVPNPKTEWGATDVVLQKLAAQLSGRVVDAAGAPVVGAEVWASGSETVATSGADGAWKLTGLPAGENEVFAATPKQFGALKVQSNSTVPSVVTLRPAAAAMPDFKTTRGFLQELVKENKGWDAIAPISVLAMTDPDTALVLAGQLDDNVRDEAVARSLRAFVQHDPARAKERLPDLLGALPAPIAGREGLKLAAQIASIEPDEARAIFDRERAKLPPLDLNNSTTAYTRGAVVGLAARLNLPEANTLADEALATLVKRFGETDHSGVIDGTIEQLAIGGGAFTERALAQLPVSRRLGVASRVLPVLAQFDLDGARHLLDLIPGWTQPAQTDVMSVMRADSAFAHGVLAVIPRLGRTDPAAALALARRVTSDNLKAQPLASAATWQPRAEAEKLLREASEMSDGNGFSNSRLSIATRASAIDATLGEKMALDFEKRLQSADNPFGREMVSPELAWILARTQPGRARLLLEREWANARDNDPESWRRQGIAFAMANADWERAVDMAKSLATPAQDRQNARSERRLLLLLTQWALAPSQLRAAASLNTAQSHLLPFDGETF
ncbi:MAG TPA: carboxypeptidase-like regulatory domain-containing protein [Abditibacteriaceae bacterium]